MIRSLKVPDCEARRAWLERRRRTRPGSFAVTRALIVWPARSVVRRGRARFLEASYRRGRPVVVRMARRVRPQDSWTSGKFAAAPGFARWRTLCGSEWSALSETVADRLVGDARHGATVFSLRDGTQVSVSAVHAGVVRVALAAGTLEKSRSVATPPPGGARPAPGVPGILPRRQDRGAGPSGPGAT